MKCLNCTYETNIINELNRHQHQHSLKKCASFKCFSCGIVFNNYRVFKVHIFRNHPLKNVASQSHSESVHPKTQKNFACKKCSFFSPNIQNLINHTEKKHFAKGQEIVCCQCTKTIFTKGNFKTHFKRFHQAASLPNQNTVEESSHSAQPQQLIIESAINSTQPQIQVEPQLSGKESHIEQILVELFLKLKAKYGVIEDVIQLFYDEIQHIVDLFGTEVQKIVREQPQNVNNVIQPKLANIQQRFKLSSLSSAYKRKKAFEKYVGFVAPQTVLLGKNDDHEDCSYQYVSIQNSLTNLLSEIDVLKNVVQEKISQKDVLNDYNDGDLYKSKNKDETVVNSDDLIVELIIFSDAFGLCNALSAKSSKYKLNGFYYVIGNFNPKLRATIDTIQLISLCYDRYIKNFGWNKFAEHMVNELKKLESTGFDVQNKHIQVKLVSIAGDNLGSHALGGFTENFSKVNFFCRFCYMTQDELKKKNLHLCPRRSPDNYIADVQAKKETDTNFKGVKFDSKFNELASFHVCDPGLPPCIGHDLFHGSFSKDLQLIVNKLVELNIFTIGFLNALLRKFVKMYRNYNSFPKLSTTNKKLKGSMSEINKLITVLPYIMLHATEEHENLRELILTMVRITQIVTAPSLSTDQVVILREEIDEYFNLRLVVFPDATLLPKHHQMKHYPELICLLGPLSKFSTLPFEHKHQVFKNMILHSRNFINAPKTLAERHQLHQALLRNDRFQATISTNSAQIYDKSMFNMEVSNEFKFISRFVTYNHQKFAEKDLIVFGFDRTSSTIKVMDIKYMLIDESYTNLLFFGPTAKLILNSKTELYEPIRDFTTTFSLAPAQDLLIYKPVNGYRFNNRLHISLPFIFPIIY
jgi:hypothetical protein